MIIGVKNTESQGQDESYLDFACRCFEGLPHDIDLVAEGYTQIDDHPDASLLRVVMLLFTYKRFDRVQVQYFLRTRKAAKGGFSGLSDEEKEEFGRFRASETEDANIVGFYASKPGMDVAKATRKHRKRTVENRRQITGKGNALHNRLKFSEDLIAEDIPAKADQISILDLTEGDRQRFYKNFILGTAYNDGGSYLIDRVMKTGEFATGQPKDGQALEDQIYYPQGSGLKDKLKRCLVDGFVGNKTYQKYKDDVENGID